MQMTDSSLKILKLFILFTKNLALVINAPYVAFRKLGKGEDVGQTGFIFAIALLYFAFASLIRQGLSNPYLLTLEFNKLVFFSSINFLLSIVLLYQVGKMFGGKGTISSIFLSWSYTLLPTITWFFITSLMYIFLPPPRTLSTPGKLFSIAFIAISLTLLFWKLVLYYLTLRFSFKLDLLRIIGVSIVLAPFICIYGIGMYRLGVFRIPFI